MSSGDELKTAMAFATEDGGQPVVRCSHCFNCLKVPTTVARTLSRQTPLQKPILEGAVKKRTHRGRRGGQHHRKSPAAANTATKAQDQARPLPGPDNTGSNNDNDVELLCELSSLRLTADPISKAIKQEMLDA